MAYQLSMTFDQWGPKRCNTDGRSVWTVKGTMLKNKPNLVTFHEIFLVGQWTFQRTLARVYFDLLVKIRILPGFPFLLMAPESWPYEKWSLRQILSIGLVYRHSKTDSSCKLSVGKGDPLWTVQTVELWSKFHCLRNIDYCNIMQHQQS